MKISTIVGLHVSNIIFFYGKYKCELGLMTQAHIFCSKTQYIYTTGGK